MAVLASAAAAFFYVRVIVVMYFHEPDSDSAHVAHPSILSADRDRDLRPRRRSRWASCPGPVLDLARTAGQFIR